MEPRFQTSFIPKKPIGSPDGSGVKIVHSTNIFSVIATVIFIITVLMAGGLFFYKNILANQIKESEKKLAEAQDAYALSSIKELLDVSARITSANSLLNKHVAVSKVLVLIGDLTVRKLRFTDLTYTIKNNIPTVAISGEVQTYNALAEQQDKFLKNEFIKNPTFSNFNLGDNGYIIVDFSTNIDPNFVSYKSTIEN
ncbi:MAG: hypothetical protein A2566_03485 [Candidatus Zambryskibacteria bacterium RIFOXYD1_FULL_40_13]|nr:MAG: hypothetical protein UT25_C0002G0174 [Parcubacteria group bacterium GW2011_GWC1_39_12]KKR19326.1 MAG: hypothetical protein UT49_C0002G0172 [Parcubacteria group bacterium GW2011_GWF1_39_37]KKR35291.1 MAG: hypothetical protein UT68_C0004G0099 [Parcubacteria group bacterium GW2011_GWC2_40_10]KKR52277.1 MAG: hypothetical protein UT89_C0002G0078 [Parcubacteria group bacterium GW2011_GWE1_40_20]KKR65166.1 MAG: hypothetical protein UU06_C0027G0006 [Parcubacteria group bacterium GW2011_GWB1_40_